MVDLHSALRGANLHVPLGYSPDALTLPANAVDAFEVQDNAGNTILLVDTTTGDQRLVLGDDVGPTRIELADDQRSIGTLAATNRLWYERTVVDQINDVTDILAIDMSSDFGAPIVDAHGLACMHMSAADTGGNHIAQQINAAITISGSSNVAVNTSTANQRVFTDDNGGGSISGVFAQWTASGTNLLVNCDPNGVTTRFAIRLMVLLGPNAT